MFLKTLVGIISLGVFATAIAQTDVSGTWMLNGPGTESEVLLTEEGKRLQGDYDLLVDDPSLYCTPASSSRIWANPGAPIKIEQTATSILISYELFDLRREIPLGDESTLTDQPSTQNLNGTFFGEMGSSFASYEGERLIIESRNHGYGYIRTSRGIPQVPGTIAIEVLEVEGDTLQITHTYTDETIFEKPLVLEYFFKRSDETELNVYDCTEANYNWFDELNAN
ncbi:MAG: hypothetical protein ACI80L_000118 [Pseudohongiellaceae bacterium]|jgi:hypothetical protein|nr:hypothetical protein [Pseudomonadota bacterium]MDA1291678.1 hypothetical protein [Pseudomonadota bacterium]